MVRGELELASSIQKDNSYVKVGIAGATGYTGLELIRLLSNHPRVKIVSLSSERSEGINIEDFHPPLKGYLENLRLLNIEDEGFIKEPEIVFLALPHGKAMDILPTLLKNGRRIIDLSADFRFDDYKVYEEWYNTTHKCKEFLKNSVYGLPEIHRKDIKNSSLIAVPGCFPTSVIIPLVPLIKENIIDVHSIIVDSKSGISGAGRKTDITYHFPECNENIKAYNVASHRHTPEIEQELSKIANMPIKISFTPHLIPVNRGILSTIYSVLTHNLDDNDIYSLYINFYRNEPFVRIFKEGKIPSLNDVSGSNYCYIGFKIDNRTRRLIVISVIDNLVKGASGNAIQDMNIIMDYDERLGIYNPPIFP
jgi:N-acetyl-gamma-glutamyl-phosphate reductase